MNLDLKAVYFCSTGKNTWGKGLTIAEAKKAAQLTKADEKKIKFRVWAACLMNPNEEGLQVMLQVLSSDPVDGHAIYLIATPEERISVSQLHVGWLLVEQNFEE